MMGTCQLCTEDGQLVDSHIIPKAFHRDLKSDATVAPVIVSGRGYPKRSPGGIYQENMLCRPCEERFGPWDDYGARCFIQNYDKDVRVLFTDPGTGQVLASQFPAWDEQKIRMFALSLLWRAAKSTLPYFTRVTLGPSHMARLQNHIISGDPGPADDFSVFLVRWTTQPHRDPLKKLQFSPYAWRMEGVNEVKMFLGGGVIHVKVDQRPFPSPFDELMLRPDRPVYAIHRELEGSQDIVAMRPAFDRWRAHAASKAAAR